MKITKIFNFEAGHRLSHYAGKCFYLHGHSYKLEVTVAGVLNKLGMIIDFGVLKDIVNKILDKNFDHKMIMKKDDLANQAVVKAFIPSGDNFDVGYGFYLVDYNPTAENIGLDLFNKIKADLKDGVILSKIVLYETETSYAEITK